MESEKNQKLSPSAVTASLQMRRGLLKRSKALTMDVGDRVAHFRGELFNPSISESISCEDTDNAKVFPSLPDKLLKAIGLLDSSPEDNKNLNEPDIEEKFARLSLAFKTDKFTLGKRLELQARQRDIAEKNIEVELKALRESLNALNQLCTESDMREVITKTQQHVDIVQQATMRMSSRAETYGAVQQEQRLNCAFETMLNYVEHLKLLYDKEHIELEEYRRLLAENNLLPDEKGSLDGDDSKRSLPPRSHSLSSSSKPEARTRLLSSVCLLNNNYESPRSAANGSTTPSSGSVSPKSRRSSLPVGPLAQSSHSSNSVTQITCGNRTHKYISETKNEGKESQAKHLQENVASILKAESSDSAFGTEEMETHKDPQAQSAYEKETSLQKDMN